MKDFNPYKWGVKVTGMVIFLLAITATIVTLNCSLGTKSCEKGIVDNLWRDSLIGALALMTATAGQFAVEVINTSNQTSAKRRNATQARSPEV